MSEFLALVHLFGTLFYALASPVVPRHFPSSMRGRLRPFLLERKFLVVDAWKQSPIDIVIQGFYADTHIRRPAMLHKVSDDCARRVFFVFYLSFDGIGKSVIAPDLQITSLAFGVFFMSPLCNVS
mgnify:CR=1 FL=1